MAPETSIASIVLVGQFNVDDFLPKKLVENDVVDPDDLRETVWNTYVPSQVLDVTLPFGKLVVGPNQLIVTVSETPHIAACDFVRSALLYAGDFRIAAMGINLESTFKFEYTYQRDNIGIRLAPPSAWGKWGEDIESDLETSVAADRMSGLTAIAMRKGRRDLRGVNGYTEVRVTPAISHPSLGITIVVNNHFQCVKKLDYSKLGSRDLVDYRDELLVILDGDFDQTINHSRTIMDGILEAE